VHRWIKLLVEEKLVHFRHPTRSSASKMYLDKKLTLLATVTNPEDVA